MKKVGIITINRGENYGNRLQNYALQEAIRKLGFSSETINNSTRKGFKSNSITKQKHKLRPSYALKVIKTRVKNQLLIKNDSDRVIKSIFWYLRNKEKIKLTKQKREEAFNKFLCSYLNISKFSISVDHIDHKHIKQYDFFVCGSDQIWNPHYPQTSGIDFLDFTENEKKIAYAPSFGVDDIPEDKKDYYKAWLNNIPYLSVREKQGAKIIKELTGRDVPVLPDPTLLLNKEDWLKISKKPSIDTDEPFILTYFLGNLTKVYERYINTLARELSCKVINLADIREFESYQVGPEEFVYFINNAKLVCTDSFHGVIMSLIMRTNFIVFSRVEEGHSMHSRIATLLEKFHIQERHFDSVKQNEGILNMNFLMIEPFISEEQEKGYKYLQNILLYET